MLTLSIADLRKRPFGDLVVLKFLKINESGAPVWQCKCKCGRLFETTAGRLISGVYSRCPACVEGKPAKRGSSADGATRKLKRARQVKKREIRR